MPLSLVVVGVWTPVSTLMAVTVEPTTAAPLGSEIVPVIEPVIVCPNATEQARRRAKKLNAKRALIGTPPIKFVLRICSLDCIGGIPPRWDCQSASFISEVQDSKFTYCIDNWTFRAR